MDKNCNFDYKYYMKKIDRNKHKQIFLIIIILINRINIESILYSTAYYFEVPKFICLDNKYCNEIKACKEFNNNPIYKIEFNSIISEYKLICSSEKFKSDFFPIVNIIASILSLVFMFFINIFGRKKGLIFMNINTLIGITFMLLPKLTFKYIGYTILRSSCFLLFGLSNIYLNEFIIDNLKYQALNYTSSLGTIGSFSNSFFSLFINSYKELLLIQVLLTIISLVFCFYLIEPPIFYYLKKDIKNLKKTFEKIMNKKKNINLEIDYSAIKKNMLDINKNSFKNTLSIMGSIFINYKLFLKFFSCLIIYLFCDFLENSIVINSQFIGFNNENLNNKLLSLAQFLSYILFIPISTKVNRKYFTLFLNFFIFSIGIILFLMKFLNDNFVLKLIYTIIIFILKFINGFNMSMLFILIVNIFDSKQKLIFSEIIFFVARLLMGFSEKFTYLAIIYGFHRLTFICLFLIITFPFYLFIK